MNARGESVTTAITVADKPGRCPDLPLLEATPLAPEVREHVDTCAACALVVEVVAERNATIAECLRFDALISARSDGTLNAAGNNLLDRHLASCASCREVAGTESPDDDLGDEDGTLPEVDPANYKIERAIAQGGMGKILFARDVRVGRPVAIKELLGDSPRLAVRFEREARLTARLQHPNIIPIYEIGRWPADGARPGKPFYSMRMVVGRQLHVAIGKAATLPERLALVPSLIAACEAVAFAHSQRVIHRDLTPSNILVGDYGETVVIDWGLAKKLGEEPPAVNDLDPGSSDHLTNVGTVMGTAAYMPPEQAHAQPVDERADVYALGAILYHLLAGVPPYRGNDRDELLREVRTGPPDEIDLVTPGSPRDLVSIVKHAMARMPEDRYPTARELADELERFQTGRLVEAHHYSRGDLVKRFIKRNRAALTVTLLATIILSVLGTISVRRIIASSAHARAQAKEAQETASALLLEKGRVELLDGEPLRALAYLHEAARQGEAGPELDLLLGRASIDLGSAERTLECGSDDRHVDVSPDGTLLVAGCHDRAKVWRIRDPRGNDVGPIEIATLGSGMTAGFDNLRFSNGGTLLATWGDDGVVRLWRLAGITSNTRSTELGHGTSTITMASFSHDDRMLSTTGWDGYARIWDVETGAERVAIPPATPIPNLGVVFGRLATRTEGSATKTELLLLAPALGVGKRYDVDTKAEIASFELGGRVINGDLSADGKLALACGSNDNAVKVIDIATGKLRFELAGHTDVVWKCVFSADGTRVLTSSHDRTAKVWDIATSPRLVATAKHGDMVWLSRFSDDSQRFFTVSPGKSIKVWDTASSGLLATYDSRGKDGRFLPDGRFAALRGDGRIQLWGRSSVRLATFDPPTGASIVAMTPDGDVATEGPNGVVIVDRDARRIADTLALQLPVAARGHQIASVYANTSNAQTSWGIAVIDFPRGSISKIPIETTATPAVEFPDTVQPAGARVALTWPTRAEIWDVATKTRVFAVPDANHVILDEDGKRAVAWRERDGIVMSLPVVWDVDRRVRSIEINAVDARPIGFALHGRRLLVNELVRAPSPVVTVFGVEDGVRIVMQPNVDIAPTLDPTRRWMTTIDKDRVVTVWDVADGARRSHFSGLPLQVAQSNGDGTLLVAIGEYGRAVLVVSPTDGRILVRHALEHERATVTGLDSFRTPPANAWWTADSAAFASMAKGLVRWRAKNPLSKTAIDELVRKRVPWRINENGELVRDGRITGRVIRDGVPVSGVAVEVLVPRPADISDKSVSWDSMKARLEPRSTVTDDQGRFVLDRLELGELEYRVSAWDGTLRVEQKTSASREGDAPIELRLR